MSAHLTFNDSVVVNIHTYSYVHTSVVPPDVLDCCHLFVLNIQDAIAITCPPFSGTANMFVLCWPQRAQLQ